MIILFVVSTVVSVLADPADLGWNHSSVFFLEKYDDAKLTDSTPLIQ